MSVLKSSLVAFVLVVGVSSTSPAQFATSTAKAGRYPAYPGQGVNSDYYGVTSGFGNYGLPGSYPGYGGNGLSGYGPGAVLNSYFTPIRPNLGPQTTNNMGGLINTIRTQTGRGNTYRPSASSGVSRRRGS